MHILHSITLWKTVQPDRHTDDSTVRRTHFACWKIQARDTHSEYVILIAFPLQQWLRERASMLRYTYIPRLGNKMFFMLLSLRLQYKYVLGGENNYSSIAKRF